MRLLAAIAAWAIAGGCLANDQEIQRALIQRDQQSAEFAAGVRGGDRASLEALHARQRLEVTTQTLHPDPAVARQLEPYQRQKMADERALVLSPPVVQVRPAEEPLPLPGGPGHVVDPIPAHSTPK
ncbi:MAG TPA: hypothetical protein VNZ59_20660 [Burkholderiales bacterium]|jgi:hypothetical protein|nr:hypothetical protein [Burkholderiales bacterium]